MPALSTYTIQQLSPGDIALMQELLAVFGVAFDEVEAYQSNPPRAGYLRELLADDSFIALAALDKEVVVGGLAAYVLRKFEQERSEVYIYDLAVAAGQRRRGIATALIRELTGIAAKQGAHGVFVQAVRGDEPATALYTKLGKREEVLHFDLALPRSTHFDKDL